MIRKNNIISEDAMRGSISFIQLINTAFICALILFIFSDECSPEVVFDRINGSDLGMGIGARAIGLGGAFVSIADDPSAVFWNPSGLTQIQNNKLYISADLPGEFSTATLIYRPGFSTLRKYEVTMGLSLINRLSFKGDSGSDTWTGYSSHLLDLAMIDVEDDFSGEIDSRTYDLRFSLGIVPGRYRDLSLGLNLVHIS